MAKTLENPILTPIFTHKRFRRPEPSIESCGCGKPAKYEVYESRQLHCSECLSEAIESLEMVQVRMIDRPSNKPYGGWDDAS